MAFTEQVALTFEYLASWREQALTYPDPHWESAKARKIHPKRWAVASSCQPDPWTWDRRVFRFHITAFFSGHRACLFRFRHGLFLPGPVANMPGNIAFRNTA